MRRLSPLLAAAAALLAGAAVVQQAVQAQTGPLPLVAVFEVHVLAAATIAAVLALPGALARGAAGTRLAIVAVLVVALVRLGGELWSPGPAGARAAAPAGSELVVLSWNLERGSRAGVESAVGIAEIDADLVALQELTTEAAAAIEADAALRARYPYRILEPREGVEGMGLLAKLPLVVGEFERDPMLLRAGLLLPDGRRLEVIDAHPYPPSIQTAGGIPVSLDTRARDERLRVIAARIAEAADPAGVLLVGDLNTAATEPAFGIVSGGLADAHGTVGVGPGFTWRPSAVEGLGIGVLRIDHVLAGAWLTPIAVREDCTLPGDHCRVVVTLRVES